MKKLFGTLAIAALFSSSVAFASPLEGYMETMKDNFETFTEAKTNTEALTALSNMKTAANQAKMTYPRKVNTKNAAQVKAYQSHFAALTTQIDQATALVKAGKLKDAQKYVVKIKQIEKTAHKQYR